MNFLVIGAQKAGTTWLYKRLNELEAFDLPPIKELHYFDRADKYPSHSVLRTTNLSKRILDSNWLSIAFSDLFKSLLKWEISDLKWKWKYYFSRCSDEWYLSLFKNRKGLSGELTPAYAMLDKTEVEKMYQLLPDIKLIFMIRNPVERTWSSFKFAKRNASLDNIDLSELIQFANYPGQELRNDYLRTLEVFRSVYPKEQILVGFYDALINQPQKLLFEIVKFIGGDPEKVKSECHLKEKNNASQKVTLPIEAEQYLRTKYSAAIQLMAERFKSYSLNWLHDKQENTDCPPVIYFD